jgi:hypothetical protein
MSIYLLSLFAVATALYFMSTSPARTRISNFNIISRCIVSYMVSVGVLTCIKDLGGF